MIIDLQGRNDLLKKKWKLLWERQKKEGYIKVRRHYWERQNNPEMHNKNIESSKELEGKREKISLVLTNSSLGKERCFCIPLCCFFFYTYVLFSGVLFSVLHVSRKTDDWMDQLSLEKRKRFGLVPSKDLKAEGRIKSMPWLPSVWFLQQD